MATRNGRAPAAATPVATIEPARAPVRTRSALKALNRHRQFALALPVAADGTPGRMTKVSDFRGQRGVRADWQAEAFAYAATIEPVGYVVNLTANTVAACDLNVGYVDDDGTVVTSGPEAEDKRARAALQALKGPRGGQRELMRRSGLLATIVGELYLLGTAVPDQKNAIWWEALSPREIKPAEVETGSVKRDTTGAGGSIVDLPPDSYLSRIWRSDPEFSDRADCALKRCLDTCRELTMLTHMMEAVITSRLAAGLLLVPKSLKQKSPLQRMAEQSNGPDDVDEEDNEFIDDLLEHLSAPVEDLKSAASIVPLLVEGEAEDLKEIRTVELGKELDIYASSMRSEMIRRLAIGMDIPPEILEGKGGLNHWTGFSVDQDFLFKHVQPVGDLIADGFTTAYFQPVLTIMQGLSKEEAARYVLVFDTSPIAAQPDEADTAMRLWDAMVISDRTLIEKQGWDPEAVMPDEDEVARRILLKVLLTRTPNVRLTDEAFKELGLKPEWFEWVSGAADTAGFPTDAPPDDKDIEPQGDEPAGAQPGETVPGQGPEDAGQEVGEPNPRGDAESPMPDQQAAQAARTLLVERLRVMVDASRDRVLELAGARINDKATRSRTFDKDFARRPKVAIPALVDEDDLRALRVTVDQLFGPSPWEGLQVRSKAMIAHYLEDHGRCDTHTAVRAAAAAASGLVAAVDDWVRSNLHRPVPYGPDGLHTPVELVACHIPEPPPPVVARMRPRALAGAR